MALTPAGEAFGSGVPAGQTTFGGVAVGQTSAPVTVVLTAQATGVANTPQVFTEGSTDGTLAEFTLMSAGTCGSNPNLSPGQSCTVSVSFAPRFPGVRHGAVALETSGGQVLASTLISGLGQGGLPVLIPGEIGTVAGNGQWFYEGDNVPATQAPIYLPSGLAVDGAGNLFLADTINNRVRRVDAVTHVITTVAGTGTAGHAGDGGLATNAEVNNPAGLAMDGEGNLYIADTGNQAIRRVDAISHVITTIAGTLGTSGATPDGPALSAKLNAPQGIALTPSGDVLIADTNNNVVRLLTMNDGNLSTIAGTGTAGYNGDGVLATAAQLNEPTGVAVHTDGTIAVADLGNNRVRVFTVGANIVTVAGNGSQGYAGDGGSAAQAVLQGPAAVAFDPAGDLFIADSVNNCIRMVYGAQKIITTLAGTPTDDRYAGDGGPENQARMHGPDAVVFDATGNLWIADRFNNRVREVNGSLLTIGPYPTMKVGKLSQPVLEQMMDGGNQPLTLAAPVLQQAALDPDTTTCAQSAMSPSDLCQMGVKFAPTNVGPSINGSITWNSDAPNVTPIDQLYGQVLSVEPTSTALQSSANPSLLGQGITLTASVTSADTGRTGTVDFVEGSTTWCSQRPLGADGTATCQVPGLSLGTHSFVANYSGDNNNAASQSPAFVQTVKQQAALALAVSSSPAVVTNNVVLTLTASDSTGTPGGSVIFFDGSTPLQTVTLDSSGHASWSTAALSVGQHMLSAQYAGDASNMPGTSSTVMLEVDQAGTTTVLTSDTNNASVGSTLNFTASVMSSISAAASGSVQFMDGASVLGTGVLGTDGTAHLSSNALAPGSHALHAVYGGDTDHATSTSATLTQTVQQIATVTALGAAANPVAAGASVHLTATVQMAPGMTADGQLTGNVVFNDGGTVLGSAGIDADGQATLVVPSLSVGVHQIVAGFSGNTNYAASQSAAFAETVQQTASAIVLSAASSNTLMGKPASFQVAVSSQTGVPTGTVTFRDGGAVLGTATLDGNGHASFATAQLSSGGHNVVAAYGGDANYLASLSQGLQITVSLAQPTVALSAPVSTIDAGLSTQIAVVLATEGVAPTGSLSLMDGAAVLATQPVAGTGTLLFSSAGLAIGAHQLSARYSGDTNNAAAVSLPISFTVQQAPTVATLRAGANPLTQGQSLPLTASVASDSPAASGSVTFFDGSANLGSIALGADGNATLTVAALGTGIHHLRAVYSGDVNHAGATSTDLPELVVQALSLTVASSANPAVSGQTIVFSGHLSGSPTPTGSLSFSDGNNLLAKVALDATGAASFSTNNLAVGGHTLVVSYSGDTNFAATSTNLNQTVLTATTATALSADANPATFGTVITFSVAVASNGGAATGQVNLEEAGSKLGSATLDGSGKAAIRISTLLPGAHNVTASYPGDGRASASNSAPLAIVVKQNTSLALTSNADPTLTLTPVTLTAAVSNAGAAPATGTVTFTEGAAVLGSAAVQGGKASLQLNQMAAGTHAIVASYAGDIANFASQSATLKQDVQLRPTTTTVTGTGTDTANPQQMTLIAVVRGEGNVPPSGTVNFMAGSLTLGAAQVDSTGVASITVLFETPTQQVVASYNGDVSYSASQSAPTPITAGKPAQFTLSVSNPDVTLASHQRTTLTVTLASVKGFTDNIGLGCMGLPYAATCTFDRSQLKLNADGTISVTLTLDTGNPLGAGTSTASNAVSARPFLLCCTPLGLLLGMLPRRGRRKRLPALLVLFAALLAGAGGLVGCGGLQMSGTPPGTYSFKVIGTGQGSNTTESQTVNLVVTQ